MAGITVIQYTNHLKAISNLSSIPFDICNIIVKYVIDQEIINSCLIGSTKKNNLEVIKYLYLNGANLNAKDNLAGWVASHYGHLEIVRYFHQNKADEIYLLRTACMVGNIEIIKYICENNIIDITKLIDAVFAYSLLSGKVMNYLLSLHLCTFKTPII